MIPTTMPVVKRPPAVVAQEREAAEQRAQVERQDQAALFGSSLLVHMRDGSELEVKVRLASVREMPDFFDMTAKEAELIEWICGMPAGWADGLTPDSHFALVARIVDLNFPLALRWIENQLAILARMYPSLERKAGESRSPRPAPSPETSSASG
jgi:hypothetical protein